MQLSMLQHRLGLLSTRYRLGLSFCGVCLLLVGLDVLARELWGITTAFTHVSLPIHQTLEIGYAPEVWLSVIGLTLGTLVIVISIAAQTIPKVADLYRKDWVSLLFIWFVIGGSTHAVYLKFLQDNHSVSAASITLNLFILLPIAIIAAFPYVFYVLKNIQPETVIQIIFKRHLSLIHCLSHPSIQKSLHTSSYRDAYHQNLLDSLNQLENIFSYVTFKEPKAQIIQTLGTLMEDYIWLKPNLAQDFFAISPVILNDIAFQTMTDQFSNIEHGRTFYEQKCFRILGNAYIMLLTAQDFDLASLCGAKLEQVGHTAMKANDIQLLNVIILRMNTLMRFALKHGKTHDEARHLYNLVFHYRRFIEDLIDANHREQTQRCVYYLRTYGNEAYQYGRTTPPLLFIVDVIAAEIKIILVRAYQAHWPLEIQRSLLKELLQVDNPPELDPSSVEPRHTNTGVRILQISLALFYLSVELVEFVQLIIDDILDDMAIVGVEAFQTIMEKTCDRMKQTTVDYWEFTDRGNRNLYFTQNLDQIQPFMILLNQKLQIALRAKKFKTK